MTDATLPEGIVSPIADRTIGAYVAAVASGAPTPGGGSVVAVVGALAAALGEMVCRLTLARAVEASAQERLRDAGEQAADPRARLLDLAMRDEAAYQAYRTAAALPRSTIDDRERRTAALEDALHVAAEVPLMTATSCHDVLVVLQTVARHGSRHALTDVTTATFLAEAGLRGAIANVRTNTALMRDREYATDVERRVAAVAEGGPRAAAAALEIVRGRGS